MRIILQDPTLILVSIVGTIFSVAMIGLLLQLTGEIDTLIESWNTMTCSELSQFLESSEYQKLSKVEVEDFHNALEFCSNSKL